MSCKNQACGSSNLCLQEVGFGRLNAALLHVSTTHAGSLTADSMNASKRWMSRGAIKSTKARPDEPPQSKEKKSSKQGAAALVLSWSLRVASSCSSAAERSLEGVRTDTDTHPLNKLPFFSSLPEVSVVSPKKAPRSWEMIFRSGPSRT